MDLNIVDVPAHQEGSGYTGEVIQALKTNPGKAIEIPLGEKDGNNVRKTIRIGLDKRGMLSTHMFRTKIDDIRNVLIVWLREKPAK